MLNKYIVYRSEIVKADNDFGYDIETTFRLIVAENPEMAIGTFSKDCRKKVSFHLGPMTEIRCVDLSKEMAIIWPDVEYLKLQEKYKRLLAAFFLTRIIAFNVVLIAVLIYLLVKIKP